MSKPRFVVFKGQNEVILSMNKHYIYIFCVFLFSCGGEPPTDLTLAENKTMGSPLFLAAISENFTSNKNTQKRLQKQNDTILGRLYLESLVEKRVAVSLEEVSAFYDKTKNQHKRSSREFLVLRFTTTNKDSALYIRQELLKNNGEEKNEKRLGNLIGRFTPRRELIKESFLLDKIKKQFLVRRGGPTVVGPLRSGKGFYLFRLVKTYESGTTKDLVHIQDDIRAKIYLKKSHAIRAFLLDSLSGVYAGRQN